MAIGHGYQAHYDYVDLVVEPRGDHWRLILRDRRHAENVESEENFATAAEAQDAAFVMAQHHINVRHNDTLLNRTALTWSEI